MTKAVEKGALRGDQAGAAMAIIHPMRHLQRLREAQVVIEAIPEDAVMKRALFAQLGQVCEPSTLLASNTSSISIASLGMASGRPDRVLGLHFMNPVPVMRLVEVVRAIGTSEQAMRLALELIRRAGKRRSSAKIFPASSSIACSSHDQRSHLRAGRRRGDGRGNRSRHGGRHAPSRRSPGLGGPHRFGYGTRHL